MTKSKNSTATGKFFKNFKKDSKDSKDNKYIKHTTMNVTPVEVEPPNIQANT